MQPRSAFFLMQDSSSSGNSLCVKESFESQAKDFYLYSPQERKTSSKELGQLVQKFDEDKSGSLNSEQFVKLIKNYDDGREVPTGVEVAWILQAAGKKNENCVDASEIQLAIDLWHSYQKNRALVEEVFEKYDTKQSGKLEFDQLKQYLKDLNKGNAPKAGF